MKILNNHLFSFYMEENTRQKYIRWSKRTPPNKSLQRYKNPAIQSDLPVGSRYKVDTEKADYTWAAPGDKHGLRDEDIEPEPIVGAIGNFYRPPTEVRDEDGEARPISNKRKVRYKSIKASQSALEKNSWVQYVKECQNQWRIQHPNKCRKTFPELVSDFTLQLMYHAEIKGRKESVPALIYPKIDCQLVTSYLNNRYTDKEKNFVTQVNERTKEDIVEPREENPFDDWMDETGGFKLDEITNKLNQTTLPPPPPPPLQKRTSLIFPDSEWQLIPYDEVEDKDVQRVLELADAFDNAFTDKTITPAMNFIPSNLKTKFQSLILGNTLNQIHPSDFLRIISTSYTKTSSTTSKPAWLSGPFLNFFAFQLFNFNRNKFLHGKGFVHISNQALGYEDTDPESILQLIQNIVKKSIPLTLIGFESNKRESDDYFTYFYNVGATSTKSGYHWSLIIGDFRRKTIWCYDPLGETDTSSSKIKNVFIQLGEYIAGDELNWEFLDIRSFPEGPSHANKLLHKSIIVQEDAVNCGTCCAYFLMIFTKYIQKQIPTSMQAAPFHTIASVGRWFMAIELTEFLSIQLNDDEEKLLEFGEEESEEKTQFLIDYFENRNKKHLMLIEQERLQKEAEEARIKKEEERLKKQEEERLKQKEDDLTNKIPKKIRDEKAEQRHQKNKRKWKEKNAQAREEAREDEKARLKEERELQKIANMRAGGYATRSRSGTKLVL
jgi:hypothetical protein